MDQLCVVYRKLTSKYTNVSGLKVKGWEKIYHANRSQKSVGIAELIFKKYIQSKG
jgi:hypothetical protein